MKIWDKIKTIEINFCKCGLAGLCLEIMFTGFEALSAGDLSLRGKTSVLMFPIYGMGAFLPFIGERIDRWLPDEKRISYTDRIFRHGTLYMVLIFMGEYISGTLLKSKGICPWDYTGYKSNINGLIRLDFAPLWFAVGLFFEKLTAYTNLKEKTN